MGTHSDHCGIVSSQKRFQLADFEGNLDQALQSIRSGPAKRILPGFWAKIPLHVHPHRRTLTSSSTQPEHHTRSIRECDNLSLILRDGVVNWVLILKVV